MESANTPYVFVLGNFNADIQSHSVFGSELIEFCDSNQLDFIDKCSLPSSYLTFTLICFDLFASINFPIK